MKVKLNKIKVALNKINNLLRKEPNFKISLILCNFNFLDFRN
jgi:hypothetical protein